MRKQRKLVVIAKLKDFDDEAWKRLLTTYAYYLHDERQKQPGNSDTTDVESERAGGGS